MSSAAKIAMISTFGPNVRGISPYSDYLSSALEEHVDLIRFDFAKVYPMILHPGSSRSKPDNQFARLHYARPSTWGIPVAASPDLIHLQYWTPICAHMLCGIAKRARKIGIATVLTVHNPKQHEQVNIFRYFEKALFKTVDRIVVHTETGKQILVESGTICESKIVVIPHGAAVEDVPGIEVADEQDYQTAKLNPKTKYLFSFGNIRKYKGVDILLDAWSRINAEFEDVQLIVAGRIWQGDNYLAKAVSRFLGTHQAGQKIQQIASNGKVAQTIFRLEFVSQEEFEAICRIAVLGVFPYRRFASQSGAATLVGSRGVPLIVSGVGGLPELAIDKSFVCWDLTADKLAQLMAEKLNYYDSGWRFRQRDQLSSYSWTSVAGEHAALYRKLLFECS